MVSVVTNLPKEGPIREADLEAWLAVVGHGRSEAEQAQLGDAGALAMAIHSPAQPAIDQKDGLRDALATADILAEMNLDGETLIAAILHDAHAFEAITPELLRARFGNGVAQMVGDMGRIGALACSSHTSVHREEASHQENLRRMLLSLAGDIRVILIVLALRLHLMRTAKRWPDDERRLLARDTRDIYAPMANRLGIWQLKWELEDLSLRYLEPEQYKEIASSLDGRRADRESYIAEVMATLKEKFAAAGLHAEITGRPKHIYSIWKKMQRKRVGLDQIFDLRAVRVLVDNLTECYTALGIVHGSWRHIPGEFDDYIATPKPNGYRSIHTAVIGPEDKTLEVQIRTREMHAHAELGVAAHWRYKESGKGDADFERRVALMRDWLANKDGEHEEEDEQRADQDTDHIYVLTPRGKVIELPRGATPVDFAYAIHTEIGHRCRGAKIDGRIVQLTTALESGQMVDILTAKEGGPSRDWLSPHQGYLRTPQARNRVRQWFRQQDYQQHLSMGRSALDHELHRLGVAKPDLEQAAKRFNFLHEGDLLAAIGRGDVSPVQVASITQPHKPAEPDIPLAEQLPGLHLTPAKRHATKGGEVVVEGMDDLMTQMAGCCKPLPPDPIVGFITRGRGITIHRRDCPTLRSIAEAERARLIDVDWGGVPGHTYSVDIRILAQDRKGLLRDITAVFANEEVNVRAVNTYSAKGSDTPNICFTVEIGSLEQLSRLLAKLEQLPDVFEARRQV